MNKNVTHFKPSQVQWLGEVPVHWKVWKISNAFNRIGSGTTPDSGNSAFYNGTIPWVNTSELRENIITDTSAKLTEYALQEHSVLSLYLPGTLLIAMYGATIGRLGILGITACTNQACCALAESIHLDSKFCFYWFQMRRNEIIAEASGGGQKNINQEKIRAIRIPAPPTEEQKQIADYLDRETTEIDALVAEKEQMLALIEEKREALISHTVAHTEIFKTRLKFFTTKIGSGKTPRGGSGIYSESGIMLIRSQNVHFNGLKLDDVVFISEEIDDEMKNTRVQSGDVLLNITGASLGRCVVVPQYLSRANVSQHVSIIRCKKSLLNPTYLSYILQGAEIQNKIWGDEKGSSREGLTFEQISNFLITVPPLECQIKISSYLDLETGKADELLAAIKDSIALLKERRSALITAAVTGQIKLREMKI